MKAHLSMVCVFVVAAGVANVFLGAARPAPEATTESNPDPQAATSKEIASGKSSAERIDSPTPPAAPRTVPVAEDVTIREGDKTRYVWRGAEWKPVESLDGWDQQRLWKALSEHVTAEAAKRLPGCRFQASDNTFTVLYKSREYETVKEPEGVDPTNVKTAGPVVGPDKDGLILRLQWQNDHTRHPKPRVFDRGPWRDLFAEVHLPTMSACIEVRVGYGPETDARLIHHLVAPSRWFRAIGAVSQSAPETAGAKSQRSTPKNTPTTVRGSSLLARKLADSLPTGWRLTESGRCDAPAEWAGKTDREYLKFAHDTLKPDADGFPQATLAVWLAPRDYAGRRLPHLDEQPGGASLYGQSRDHLLLFEVAPLSDPHWANLEAAFQQCGFARLDESEITPAAQAPETKKAADMPTHHDAAADRYWQRWMHGNLREIGEKDGLVYYVVFYKDGRLLWKTSRSEINCRRDTSLKAYLDEIANAQDGRSYERVYYPLVAHLTGKLDLAPPKWKQWWKTNGPKFVIDDQMLKDYETWRNTQLEYRRWQIGTFKAFIKAEQERLKIRPDSRPRSPDSSNAALPDTPENRKAVGDEPEAPPATPLRSDETEWEAFVRLEDLTGTFDWNRMWGRVLSACAEAEKGHPSLAAFRAGARPTRGNKEITGWTYESNAQRESGKPYYRVILSIQRMDSGPSNVSADSPSIAWDGKSSHRGYAVKWLGITIRIIVLSDDAEFVKAINAILDEEVTRELRRCAPPTTQPVKGLKVSVWTDKTEFTLDEPVLVHWKIENVGKTDRIPALIQDWKKGFEFPRGTKESDAAFEELLRLGPAAVPHLIEKLEDPGYTLNTVSMLGYIGPGAKEATAPLIRVLMEDQRLCVREHAARALARIDPGSEEVVDALVKALKHQSPQVAKAAAEGLGEIGPSAGKAVPELRKAWENKRSDLCWEAGTALGRMGLADRVVPGLVEALTSPEAETRHDIARALGRIGPTAKAALPALVRALKDEEDYVRSAATLALGSMGPSVVPQLIEALRQKDVNTRIGAAGALARIGPEAKEATTALIEALKDEIAFVRFSAACALRCIGPPAKSAVPALQKAQQDQDEQVRRAAAKALEAIEGDDSSTRESKKPPGGPQTPAKRAAVPDRELTMRLSYAVSKPVPVPPATAKLFREIVARPPARSYPEPPFVAEWTALFRCDGNAYEWYGNGIGQRTEDERKCWGCPRLAVLFDRMMKQRAKTDEKLKATLEEFEKDLKQGKIPSQDKKTLQAPEMLAAVKEQLQQAVGGTWETQTRAQHPLGPVLRGRVEAEHAGQTAQAVYFLLPFRYDAFGRTRVWAEYRAGSHTLIVLALGEVGAEAGKAAPVLIRALKDRHYAVQRFATKSLGQLGPTAVPHLVEAMKDEEPEVRRSAAAVLGAIGPEASSALPTLRRSFEDQDARVRVQAAAALWDVDAAAGEAVAVLAQALQDKSCRVRESAVEVLARMAPGAEEAMPVLIPALINDDWTERCKVIRVLGKLGPAAKAAVPALQKAQQDQNEHVRKAAAEALERIEREDATTDGKKQAAGGNAHDGAGASVVESPSIVQTEESGPPATQPAGRRSGASGV